MKKIFFLLFAVFTMSIAYSALCAYDPSPPAFQTNNEMLVLYDVVSPVSTQACYTENLVTIPLFCRLEYESLLQYTRLPEGTLEIDYGNIFIRSQSSIVVVIISRTNANNENLELARQHRSAIGQIKVAKKGQVLTDFEITSPG